MSQPSFREKHVTYDVKKVTEPDEVLYLENIGAKALLVPSGGFGPQFAIGMLPLSWWWVSLLNAFVDSIDNLVETRAVTPLKFKLEVVSHDKARLDHWDDGVSRIRLGNFSVLSNDSFIDHLPLRHLKQTWYLHHIRAVLEQSANDNVGLFSASKVVENERLYAENFPTHIAWRLEKTVKLKVSIWWLYRTTIYDIVPDVPV